MIAYRRMEEEHRTGVNDLFGSFWHPATHLAFSVASHFVLHQIVRDTFTIYSGILQNLTGFLLFLAYGKLSMVSYFGIRYFLSV